MIKCISPWAVYSKSLYRAFPRQSQQQRCSLQISINVDSLLEGFISNFYSLLFDLGWPLMRWTLQAKTQSGSEQGEGGFKKHLLCSWLAARTGQEYKEVRRHFILYIDIVSTGNIVLPRVAQQPPSQEITQLLKDIFYSANRHCYGRTKLVCLNQITPAFLTKPLCSIATHKFFEFVSAKLFYWCWNTY